MLADSFDVDGLFVDIFQENDLFSYEIYAYNTKKKEVEIVKKNKGFDNIDECKIEAENEARSMPINPCTKNFRKMIA